jgi:hypothetical protein
MSAFKSKVDAKRSTAETANQHIPAPIPLSKRHFQKADPRKTIQRAAKRRLTFK